MYKNFVKLSICRLTKDKLFKIMKIKRHPAFCVVFVSDKKESEHQISSGE